VGGRRRVQNPVQWYAAIRVPYLSQCKRPPISFYGGTLVKTRSERALIKSELVHPYMVKPLCGRLVKREGGREKPKEGEGLEASREKKSLEITPQLLDASV